MMGLEVNSVVDERRDPYKSTQQALRYLQQLHDNFGDWTLAIAAYNCGPGNVNKAIRRSGGKRDYWDIYPYLPRETRGYVPAFIAANYIMNYYDLHNIQPGEIELPSETDTVLVNKRLHFKQISDVLGIEVGELRQLNPQYRRDVVPATAKRPYFLVLPEESAYAFVENEDSICNHQSELYARRITAELAQASRTPIQGYHRVRSGAESVGYCTSIPYQRREPEKVEQPQKQQYLPGYAISSKLIICKNPLFGKNNSNKIDP